MRSAETREAGTRNLVVVRMVWVVRGEVCHFVTVLVFVRGSKCVSMIVGGTMVGEVDGGGEGEREERDSKSETSNQSLLPQLLEVAMTGVRFKCGCHYAARDIR